jgi:hypothetical protein
MKHTPAEVDMNLSLSLYIRMSQLRSYFTNKQEGGQSKKKKRRSGAKEVRTLNGHPSAALRSRCTFMCIYV